VKRAGELTQNMYELEYKLPHTKKTYRKRLQMDDEQRKVYGIIHKT